MGKLQTRMLPLGLLLVIIAAGSYVRLAHLGEAHFRNYELSHYYVGQSLQQGEGPVLPWGFRYVRGIDVSRLVGITSQFIEDPELSARLPSAMFGILGLVVFALVCWAMVGPWPAVWGVLLLAIYPEAVDQSRLVRFYTYQMIFGLGALYAGWRVVRDAGSAEHPDRSEVIRTWAWAAVAVVLFLLSLRIQVVTLTVALGWGVCVALAALANGIVRGWGSWRDNVPLQLCVVGLAVVAISVLFFPDMTSRKVAMAFSVPSWVGGPTHVLYYYYALSGAFPLLVALIPAVFIVAALRQPRLAVYLLIWFSVPLALHSLVFPFKGERFVFLAMPALFLAAGIAASAACGAMFRVTYERLGGLLRGASARKAAGVLAVSVVAGFALFATPAFNRARRLAAGIEDLPMKRENWTAARGIVDSIAVDETIPIGSVDRFAADFYWGRVDFDASKGGTCMQLDGVENCQDRGHVPHLRTASEIRDHFPNAPSVLVAIDSTVLMYGNVEPSLQQVLSKEAAEVCAGRCGSLLLYHWKLGPVGGDEDRRTSTDGAADVAEAAKVESR